MNTTLDQLKTMTTVVADTGDLSAIARLMPIDATTNPSLITKALSAPEMQATILTALKKQPNDIETVIDDLTIEIGNNILKLIEGRVSIEVDARLSYDTDATVQKALNFIEQFKQLGIDKNRILIKIASTWEGIQSAKILEEQGIHCNLTLLFGLHQAKACAEAKVTLISPFVGRITDWQKQQENLQIIDIEKDNGVQSVINIYQYFKQHGYKTQIMGASFRSTEQILALAGCDLLTIAPDLIDKLADMNHPVQQQLSPTMNFVDLEKEILDEAIFRQQLDNDVMSQTLLTNGINSFIQARQELADKLRAMC